MLNAFEAFLKSRHTHTLLDPSFTSSDYIPINLSEGNPKLKGIKVSSSSDLERFILNHIKTNKAKVAFGGYLENRNIYQRSLYFNKANAEQERHIHLGVDLWIQSNKPIFAPLSGIIHSFKNNTNHGDYGPTIILKHQFDTMEFYTLYGHLSLESLSNLKVGVKVAQGEQIATLGTAEVNGDYPPHLHFQVIKDVQGFEGDYPGVCSKKDLKFYSTNCPDPNLLLNVGFGQNRIDT